MQDLLSFTQQFATMLKAGIPLLECLATLSRHTDSQPLRRILTSVHHDVERGVGLAESLRKYPRVFNDFYVNMIEVGETTGMMDALLIRLGTYMQRQATLKGRVLSALAYPATLFGIALLVLVCMLIWVVPLFEQMFMEFGDTLPWLTQTVLDVSVGIQEHAVLLGGVFVTSVLVGFRLYRTSKGRRAVDAFLLRAPLVSRLFQKSSVVQFSRTLGILLNSGVPILEGLAVAGRVSGNRLVEEAIQHVRLRIREGETIAQPLAQSAIFPPLVTHMIRVGEATGALDAMLEQIADLYEKEMDRTATVLTSLLEPMVILFIGLGVGVMVVAMYLPLFSMGALI
ncbi:MAG: type II secretion system protein F [Nitrospirales bacterium]|nr:MAG: type II secretion system protein F [Nitrospirales bacterium]